MDPSLLILMSVIFLLLLILIGIPVSFALALTGIAGMLTLQGPGSLDYAVGQFPVSRVMTYSLTVIPLFVLMGQFAFVSGVGQDAYRAAYGWLRRLHGGLCLVTIAACGLFGATTGSSAAEVAAIGKIAIPEMKRHRYDTRLAFGTVAATGSIGILIPPSIGLALYGILTYESIGKLFIAGVFPGIVSLIIYMIMVYLRCLKNPNLAPRLETAITWGERFSSLSKCWGIILIFATVMGGLYTGIATPTEVGAVGSLIGLLMVFLAIWRKKCNWTELKDSVVETARINGMIFAFIFGAAIFSIFLTATGKINLLVQYIGAMGVNRYIILAAILIVYIPLGMLLDPTSITIITVPLVYPIIKGLGFNGIWFGIIFTKMMEIAVITPPVAINLYVLKAQFPETDLEDIIRGTFWYLIIDVPILIILIAFPSISLWLPNTIQ
jgi:C4-dicarboxylate transporter DctM subunit